MPGQFFEIGNHRPTAAAGRRYRLAQPTLTAVGWAHAQNLTDAKLRLARVDREFLVDQPRNPLGKSGQIQEELGDGLALIEALAVVAVALHGRGNLLTVPDEDRKAAKAGKKIKVDRAAAMAHGVFGDRYLLNMGVGLVNRQTEGGRWKPGETGANPASYKDQVLGDRRNNAMCANRDDVDGTGLATEDRPNSVTASQFFAGDVSLFLPDIYALTLSSGRAIDQRVTLDSPVAHIVEVMAGANGVCPGALRLAALKRSRQDDVQQAFLAEGASFVQMSDGNVVPAISAGLRINAFPDGQLLHGTFDSGGAPEAALLLPLLWLGGSVNVAPASHANFKNWATRREFSAEERALLAAAGIEPDKTLPLEKLFTEPHADGLALFGGITPNLWVPSLGGVEFGATGVRADVWRITSTGLSTVDHYYFDYTNGEQATHVGLAPLISQLRETVDARDLRDRVSFALEVDARATRIQFEQDFYQALTFRDDGLLEVNEEAVTSLRGTGRFDERDMAILNEFRSRTDWFVRAA